MKFIRNIADFLLSTYLFIASAAACFVLTTFLLTNRPVHINAVTLLVFFSTLLIYNFHRVSALFSNFVFSFPNLFIRLKKFPLSTKIMSITGIAGILCSSWFLSITTLLTLVPVALITFAYSVPVVKVKGKRKRLREVFIVKITSLSLVWCLSTVTLPMIDSGISITSHSSLAIFAERFLFMFAICVPFEIRDIEVEKKWCNVTLPILIGVNRSKQIGLLALLIFIMLVYFQFGSSAEHINAFVIPQFISALVAGLLLVFSTWHRNNYYFRIFVDGTMQLQFILLILFGSMQ